MDHQVFNQFGKTQNENGMKIEEYPFLDQLWAVGSELGFGWVRPVQSPAQKVKRGLIVGIAEVGLSFSGELTLQALEKLRISGMKLRDHLIATSLEHEEEEALELGVLRLRRVEIRQDSVPAGELSGGHKGPCKKVLLLNLADVKQDRETLPVE
ncbi:hypothetical protein TorRG33x02_151950 [Trema orientale]|uniref:Uncharacterized protein n=1 Tax=Trema orientale TaxID=63057 RepID=A0A2P5ETX0_TREOI|nr:hypothetical protein TorRG33x02_151950 [Trema orientale]